MKAINLFLLAAIIGIELFLGIVVAPVVFYPQNLIGENVLSHFQSGLMMTQIFIKMAYCLIFASLINFLFEAFCFFKDKNIIFQIKFSKLALCVLILILACVFTFYFTDKIIQMQTLGETITSSEEFIKIHSASEITLKIIVIMQIILFFLSYKTNKK